MSERTTTPTPGDRLPSGFRDIRGRPVFRDVPGHPAVQLACCRLEDLLGVCDDARQLLAAADAVVGACTVSGAETRYERAAESPACVLRVDVDATSGDLELLAPLVEAIGPTTYPPHRARALTQLGEHAGRLADASGEADPAADLEVRRIGVRCARMAELLAAGEIPDPPA